MKIINCCDHNVAIGDWAGNIFAVYEPSGNHARVRGEVVIVGYINGVAIKERRNVRIEGLPDPEEDTYYLVSDILRQACPDRKDLLACGNKKRDKNGRIICWTSFQRNE